MHIDASVSNSMRSGQCCSRRPSLQNQFDCIDLSDNNVVRLDGFPRLERLSMLIVNNNRIASIAPSLESAILMLLSRASLIAQRSMLL